MPDLPGGFPHSQKPFKVASWQNSDALEGALLQTSSPALSLCKAPDPASPPRQGTGVLLMTPVPMLEYSPGCTQRDGILLSRASGGCARQVARPSQLRMLMVGADPRTVTRKEQVNPRKQFGGHKPPSRLLVKHGRSAIPRLQMPSAHMEGEEALKKVANAGSALILSVSSFEGAVEALKPARLQKKGNLLQAVCEGKILGRTALHEAHLKEMALEGIPSGRADDTDRS